MFVRLSYDVTPDSPGWPGNPTMLLESYSSIAAGDLAAHTNIKIFSHFGSHLDAPAHWNGAGPGVTDLDLSYYIYEKPLLVDVPKGEQELIASADLAASGEALGQCDLLLLRTGWSNMRSVDPSRYAERGPALSSEAARFILDNAPKLKAIGMDCVSIGSPSNIEEAIAAHQILSGKCGGDRGLVNIEDIHLTIDSARLLRVFALPLFAPGLEGSPCTVVAELA